MVIATHRPALPAVALSKAQAAAVEEIFRRGGEALMVVIGIDTCWGIFKRILRG